MTEHIGVTPDKCRACRRCEAACIAAHNNMTIKEAMKCRDTLVSRVRVIKTDTLKTTVRCHQCNPAPCCNICPTGAMRQEEGEISFHVEHCISCKMCVSACPYGAISFELPANPLSAEAEIEGGESSAPADNNAPLPLTAIQKKRELPVRCDLCTAWRLDNGKIITACMEACPVQALYLIKADGSILEAPKPEKESKKDSA